MTMLDSYAIFFFVSTHKIYYIQHKRESTIFHLDVNMCIYVYEERKMRKTKRCIKFASSFLLFSFLWYHLFNIKMDE